MRDKLTIWFTVVGSFVLLLAFGSGCGGGGGSGSSTGTGTGNPIVRYQVEATKNNLIIDPENIVVGEHIQFVVAGYTATNQRSIQSSSGWVADPTGQTEGTMSGGGLYTATAFGPQFTVSGQSGGSQRDGVAQVKDPADALVTGRLVDGFGGNVAGAVIDLYDGSNTLVGTSTSQFDGTFRAAVPTTAVTFELRKNAIPAGYYKEYEYINRWFLPSGLCRAPLPALSSGHTSNLSGNVLVPPTSINGASEPPPPPPSPCG